MSLENLMIMKWNKLKRELLEKIVYGITVIYAYICNIKKIISTPFL